MCFQRWEKNLIDTKSAKIWQLHSIISPTDFITKTHISHFNGLSSLQSNSFVCHFVETFLYVSSPIVRHYLDKLTILLTMFTFSGKNCSLSDSPCTPDLCKNGGTCSYSLTGETQCICPAGIERAFLHSRLAYIYLIFVLTYWSDILIAPVTNL